MYCYTSFANIPLKVFLPVPVLKAPTLPKNNPGVCRCGWDLRPVRMKPAYWRAGDFREWQRYGVLQGTDTLPPHDTRGHFNRVAIGDLS
jgi:hypothetical protein